MTCSGPPPSSCRRPSSARSCAGRWRCWPRASARRSSSCARSTTAEVAFTALGSAGIGSDDGSHGPVAHDARGGPARLTLARGIRCAARPPIVRAGASTSTSVRRPSWASRSRRRRCGPDATTAVRSPLRPSRSRPTSCRWAWLAPPASSAPDRASTTACASVRARRPSGSCSSSTATSRRAGYGHGEVLVWGQDGGLVASGSQTAAMRYLFDEGEPNRLPRPRD